MGSRPTNESTQFANISELDGVATAHVSQNKPEKSHFEIQFEKTMERTRTAAAVLQAVPKEKQCGVAFKDVDAHVSMTMFQPSLASRAMSKCLSLASEKKRKKIEAQAAVPSSRQILTGINGRVQPAEVLALMGPSGSGKTTLLSILGARTASSVRVEGQIQYNGQALSKAVKRSMGFVHQDDQLFECLTVQETLHYAALLRLPRDMSREEKAKRVETVIQALGLDKCRGTIVGGFMRRGISGGERKRVSIGHELLINPSMIFLDEPTSGLDATTALKLMHTLKVLAAGGRSVITTIHQPASRIYQELDKVMVLSEGQILYYGHGALAHAWFSSLSYDMPLGVNTADFLLDLASGDVGGTQTEARVLSMQLCAAYKHFAQGGPVEPRDLSNPMALDAEEVANPKGKKASEEEVRRRQMEGIQRRYMAQLQGPQEDDVVPLSDSHLDSATESSDGGARTVGGAAQVDLEASLHTAGIDDKKMTGAAGSHASRWGASYWDQINILMRRSIKTRRFDALGLQRFLQLFIVSILTGLFWWQKGGGTSAAEINNTVGLLFFEKLFLAFAALFTALFTFPQEYQMLLKERASGMYRLSSFYIGRLAADLPLDCLYPSMVVFIVYWMGGLRADAAAFLGNWFTILLTVLVAQSLGLLLGTAVMDPKVAQTFATVIMLTFMLTAGFYVDDIPKWIAWVKYLGFPYFAWRMLIKLEFGSSSFDTSDWPSNLAHPDDISFGRECGIMVLFLVAYRLITYVELRRKTRSV